MKIIKERIKHIFKIKFIQDVGALQISTIIIAGITVITSLVIAKRLKPTDFGVYSLVLSLYSLIGMFGVLGVKQTVLVKLSSAHMSQGKEEILSILGYYFKTMLIINILIMLGGYIIAPYLSQLLYGRQDIGRLCQMLFLMPLLIILYKLVVVILEGTRNMKHLAIIECASTLLKAFILIAVVILGLGLTVLIYGWLISAIISSILALFIYKNLKLLNKGLPSISEILKQLHIQDNRNFLRFNLSMGLSENINNLNDNLPIILLGIFVLPKEVGQFKLVYSVMGILILFLEPIARNLLLKLRQLQNSQDIKVLYNTFYRVSLFSGIISMILVVLILVFYRFLVYFILRDYASSIEVAYILAVYFCLLGFGIGLSPILRALERLDIEIKINAIGLSIFIALSILFIKNLGISGMAIALVISTLFTKFVMYLSIKNLLKPEIL